MPWRKVKNYKVIMVYTSMIVFSYLLIIGITLDIPIPSPAEHIKNIVQIFTVVEK